MTHGFFGPFGNGFAAASADELRGLLSQVDSTLPHPAHGRRPEYRERYCIVQYLRTLERHGLLGFPLLIEKGERPDFEIEMGSARFGLEHTSAGSSELQAARTAVARSQTRPLIEPLSPAPGSANLRFKVRQPGEPLQGRGFVGDEVERLWTAQVLAAVQKKQKQLPAYRQVPDYHLLIWDTTGLSSLTAWTVTELPERLAAAVHEWRAAEPPHERSFSRISVLRDRVLMHDIGGANLLLPVPPSSTQPELRPLTRLGVLEEDLHAFCRRHRIRKLGFFGSAREDRFGPESDVDVLVEFEPDLRIGLIRLAGIELELTRLLGRKADLRTVPDLSRYFREEVVREKTDLVYAAG